MDPITDQRLRGESSQDFIVSFNLDVLLGYRETLEKKFSNVGNLDAYIASLGGSSPTVSEPRVAEPVIPPSSPPTARPTATSGGIILDDNPTIDDIGVASPATPRAQTPIRPEVRQTEARTCMCPVGTFEYYGMDCRSAKTYETVTTKMGGYTYHKNCGATYGSPEGDGL